MADEWRYAQGPVSPPWANGAERGATEPAADLWAEEPSEGWHPQEQWTLPRSEGGYAGPNTDEQSTGDSGAWSRHSGAWGQLRPPDPLRPDPPRPDPYRADQYGAEPYGADPYGAGASAPVPPQPLLPPPIHSTALAPAPRPAASGWNGPSHSEATRAAARVRPEPQHGTVDGPRRAAAEPWARTDPRARHRNEPPGEEPVEEPPAPTYSRVLAFTAGWYGVPLLGYAIYLVALAGDRRGTAGHQLGSSLPWLLIALVLSLGCAAGLRRTTIGWRTLGLSFAGAVIGAGIATLSHSLFG